MPRAECGTNASTIAVMPAVSILHIYLRGWLSHNAELAAHIRLLSEQPTIVCVNETVLDENVESVEPEG